MPRISEDPDPAEAVRLLDTLDRVTRQLSASLASVPSQDFVAPSMLEDWTRAHVVGHLANAADGFVRMTSDAVAGRPTRMYPGGREQRNADIEAAARTEPKQLRERFEGSAAALAAAWRALPRDRWDTTVTDAEFGTMQLGRLVALRLTEVEVHYADLAIGFGPRGWSPEFARGCLPLRVASLPRLRGRLDADRIVEGSWLLVCDDLDTQWRVETHGADVEIAVTQGRADTIIRGTAHDLMAFLLGRQSPTMLAVAGDTERAQEFKQAFPGP